MGLVLLGADGFSWTYHPFMSDHDPWADLGHSVILFSDCYVIPLFCFSRFIQSGGPWFHHVSSMVQLERFGEHTS